MKIYDDKIVVEKNSLNATGELKYDQFFALMECKDYFTFYLNANQASLVRKKDIDNPHEFKKFVVEKFESKYKHI